MSNTNGTTVAAVKSDGLIAMDEKLSGAGMITLWRLTGDMSLDTLQAAWLAEGLDPAMLCESETPSAALKRAVRDNVERSQRRMLRPLDGHKGWGSVKETANEDELSYEVGLIAKLNAAGQPTVEPASDPRAQAIVDAYYVHLDTVSASKAGAWFSWLMKKCDAVSLKDTGGTYYVPPHMVSTWEAMARAIEKSTSHKVLCIPAMRASQTVAAVLDAITQEAEGTVERMQKEIADGDLGAKALTGKRYGQAKADELEAKLARYEGILGQRLDGLREKLDDVRATISAAILASAADMKKS